VKKGRRCTPPVLWDQADAGVSNIHNIMIYYYDQEG
jgi:hypothetical protein